MVSRPASAEARLSWARRHVAGLIAALVAAAGIVNLVSGLTPEFHSRLRSIVDFVPGVVSGIATATTVVSGLLLLMLAKGLRRRKQRAWRGAVVLLGVSIFTHLVKGLDVEESGLAFGVLIALIMTRNEFTAKGDPRTRWRSVSVGGSMFAASVVTGMVLMRLYEDSLQGPHGLARQLRFVLKGLVGIQGTINLTGRADEVIPAVLGGLGIITVLTVAYLLLRPSEPVASLLPEDEARMRDLLARYGGRDSLGYFALRRDKSVVWSPSGKACIAYRVLSGVMLASGDPLGDPEAWPGAITAMQCLAEQHAWVPAVIGCGELAATAYARAGLSTIEFGDEAVVEVKDFTLEGRAMRGVRQAVNRVERAGYVAQVRRVADISEEDRKEMVLQARAWRSAETERGFSMALGRFGDPCDGECVAVTATQNGCLRAFLHFVPWGSDGLSLDLMRRDREADNGLNEFLIVSAMKAAQELGVKRMSLNFAVFRAALERGERIGAGPISRAFRGLLVFSSRWFQIDSLYRFNAKFRPIWEPRFVCYPGAGDLPRVSLAALEAEAFLVWPMTKLGHWLRRGKPSPASQHAEPAAVTA